MRAIVGFAVAAALCGIGCGSSTTPPPGDSGADASTTIVPRQPVKTSAGVPVGLAVTASIDAKGGTLASKDGRLTVEVPANAVAAATPFSLQPITSPAPSSVGVGYRLEPHGVTFTAPVTLTFKIPSAGSARTSVEGMAPAYRDEDGHWVWGTDVTRDATAKTISVKTTHFSDWSMLEGFQIRPLTATVQEGNELELLVIYCTETMEGELTGVVYECGHDGSTWATTVDWSVNGQLGGNSTLGTVKREPENASQGRFVAPITPPKPPTVAVSAKIGGTAKRPSMTVVAELSIGKPGTYHGTLKVAASGMFSYTAKGDVTVTPRPGEDDKTSTTFDMSGNLELSPNEVMYAGGKCTSTKTSQSIANVPITYIKDDLAMSFSLEAVWDLVCDNNGHPVYPKATLQWITGCSPLTMLNVPIEDPGHMEGEYTRASDNCGPGQVSGSTTVSWDFVQ